MSAALLVGLTLALAGGPGDAPADGVLRGTVRSQGTLEPVSYAMVRVPEIDRTAVADAHGFYVLAELPAGRWTVVASAMAHDTVRVTVVGSGAGTVRLDFELPLRPLVLPEVAGQETARPTSLTSQAPATEVGPPAVRLQGPALRALPGLAEADVLRALQVLPSVAATSDYSSALYVRGGSSDQTLITLDGVPLFNPYHVGGIFSAISAEAVSSVEVWPGAMPAGTGDRLSGAVDIRTRDGGRDRVRSAGALGLISTNVGVEGPLPGSRGSYLVAARRTYLDAITGAAHAVGLLPVMMPYGFSDAYAKLSHDVGLLGTLTVSGYLDAEDIHFPARMSDETQADAEFDWGAGMLAATFRRPIGSTLLLEARAGYTAFLGEFHGWTMRKIWPDHGVTPDEEANLPVDTTKTIDAETTIRDILGAVDLTWYGRRHTVRAGVQLDDYLLAARMDLLDEVDPHYFRAFDRTARPRTIAAHLEDEWRPTERLHLRAGLRYLDAGDLGAAWLPRFGARLQASDALSLSFGGGSYAQVLRSTKDDESIAAAFIAYDILAPQPPEAGLARSSDLVLGAEWRDERTRVRADIFTKRMTGLVLPPQPENPLLAAPLIGDSFRIGEGRARGLELMATRRFGDAELTGAYTLSVVDRIVEDERYTPRFERRHMLDLNLGMPAGDRGLVTARMALATGQPYTPVVGRIDPYRYVPSYGGWDTGGGHTLLGDHNSARLPGYMRIDVAYRSSFERRWFGRDITLSPYVQVVNALNNKNVLIGAPAGGWIQYWPQLPVLPTLGVEWRF